MCWRVRSLIGGRMVAGWCRSSGRRRVTGAGVLRVSLCLGVSDERPERGRRDVLAPEVRGQGHVSDARDVPELPVVGPGRRHAGA